MVTNSHLEAGDEHSNAPAGGNPHLLTSERLVSHARAVEAALAKFVGGYRVRLEVSPAEAKRCDGSGLNLSVVGCGDELWGASVRVHHADSGSEASVTYARGEGSVRLP